MRPSHGRSCDKARSSPFRRSVACTTGMSVAPRESQPQPLVRVVVLIGDGVSLGQHALMQDAGDDNAAALLAVEHDMPAILVTAQAGAMSSQSRPAAGLSASIWQQTSSSSMYRAAWALPHLRRVYSPMLSKSASARRENRNLGTAIGRREA